MFFRFAFALTIGSMTCNASVQAQEPLPHFKLAAARDSFVVQVQGKPLGHILLVTEPTETGYRITETTRVGEYVQQDTELVMDAVNDVARVKQRGVMHGNNTSIDVEHRPSHVKGSAVVPGKSHQIDMQLPENTLDDNMLQSVLPALPWSATSSWKFPVFSAGKNEVIEATLKVIASESIATSNGNVDVYRAELLGMETPVLFWIRKDAPHRIMKMAAPGAPYEIVRAN